MIDSHVKKVIFVDKPFLHKLECLSEKEYQGFINPDIDTRVITLPIQANEVSELVNYIDPSDIKAGAVLVKSDYTKNYTTIDNFSEDVVFQKFELFVRLCIVLGAKEVLVSNIENIEIKNNIYSELKLKARADYSFIDAELGVNTSNTDNIESVKNSVMRLNTKAQGSEPDFEEANKIMNEYKLAKDSLFSNIYNMRKMLTNPLVSHDLVLDFSNDYKKTFDSSLSASINIMSRIYKGNASFELAKKSLEDIRSYTKLTVTVNF